MELWPALCGYICACLSNVPRFPWLPQVCEALAKEVLSAPGQEVKIIGTTEVRAGQLSRHASCMHAPVL